MERKEAIEVIKKNWPDSSFTMLREALETLIPELKESEDERIRKSLIDYFNRFKSSDMWNESFSFGDVVSWIEKQGKLIEDYEDRLDRCACESFNKGYKAAIEHQKEKQGEQKCVIDEGKSEIDYCFTKMMNGEKVSPTWSEEDEKMLNDILMCGERHCYLDAGNIAWLKSLRDKVQPKQEWSEEDEKHYQGCLNLMKLSLDTKPYPYYNDYLWLKSIRDKVQPKPSWSEEDENMVRYIGNAITCEESAKYLEEKGVDMIKAHRWLESYKPYFKQEWSKEDDVMIRDILGWLPAKSRPEYNQRRADWLKSLKDRVQPKQEWRGEDIEMLNSAISFVEHSSFTTIGKGKNNVISWLKSLKERIRIV